MKILFVTGLYPQDSEKYYSSVLKNSSLSTPSNVYQWAVVKGLIENSADFEVCSFPFLPTFPQGLSIKNTKSEEIKYDGQTIGRSYSYSTIVGLKESDIRRKLKTVIHQWVKKNQSDDICLILIYSVYGPFLKTAVDCAKKYTNVKVCPIVTDLFISSLSLLRKYPLLKQIQYFFEYRRIKYGIEEADTFVLLAKGMEKFVPRAVNNHVIVEGIAGDNIPKPANKDEKSIKTLLYTGSLGAHTSIKELVDAFMLTRDDNFRLVICGSGCYEDYIKLKSIEDKRIIYRGTVSREESVRMQCDATVLINPRLPSVQDTPFSFPSKTIEYLVSGTPMIGYRLVGITEDYYEHFYIPLDESTVALAELITEVLHLPQLELDCKSLKAWNFIMTQKTAKQQVKKMLDFFVTTNTLIVNNNNI